jgi:diguanylate cyclase (GGDEF)-like protein
MNFFYNKAANRFRVNKINPNLRLGGSKLGSGLSTEVATNGLESSDAPLADNEDARLDALRKSQVLNLDADELFDDHAHLAANLCLAPYAMISLVESDYVLYKTAINFAPYEVLPREGSFDSWTIATPDVFVIDDAMQDERFKTHPLVTTHPRIRFYAAAPLITTDGYAIGTLCVMDWRRRSLKPFQAKALKTLAKDVVSQIELRRKNKELEMAIAQRERSPIPAIQPCVVLSQEAAPQIEEAIVAVEETGSLDDYSKEGLWEWQLANNRVNYSSKWKATLGYDEQEIGSSPNEWFNRVHPEDAENLHATILSHLSGHTPCFKNDHRILGGDGVYRWVQCRGQAVFSEQNKLGSIFGSLTAIGTPNQEEDSFKHSAYHDPLTGLPNRIMFLKRLRRRVERCRRGEGNAFAVFILDIDRFKIVNDTYGQQIGDKLLVEFAQTLIDYLRPEDVVSRLGGDEFAILMDDIGSTNEAVFAADHLKKILSEHFEIDGNEIFISAGIGIAHSQDHGEQPEDLFRNAEAALYQAKEQGRGGLEVFDREMLGQLAASSRLETGLDKALLRNELQVYYQPIISLLNYQIIGFEALLRWQHPEQGLILPNDFIPIAEETGKIIQIDNWVLSEAMKQICSWQTRFPSTTPLTVSVNLSGKRFLQKDLVTQLKELLFASGARPESLKLEITESSVIENVDFATAALKKIKDLGIQVSLDDFGKGYSSFNYLHQFPVDILKIDHSFVSTMNVPKTLQIVRTIMGLANNLGLTVVAEGVENGEQLLQLREMDCEFVQGFLFSRPLPVQAATDLLTEANQMTNIPQF